MLYYKENLDRSLLQNILNFFDISFFTRIELILSVTLIANLVFQ